MKIITAKVEITHNGKVITLEGGEAQSALNKLYSWDGNGSVPIQYTDPDTKQPQGIVLCCGDSWKRLPNKVEEVDEMPCKFCLPCNVGDEEKKSEEAVQPKPQDKPQADDKPKPSEPIVTMPITITDADTNDTIDY